MKKIRNAARTVIWDEENKKIAVMEVCDGRYYKIPGGGIDVGESEEEAATREAREEGACDVVLITKIGEAEFIDPDDQDQIHHSVCFLARKIKDHPTTRLTDDEKEKKFKLLWLTINEALELFANAPSLDAMELEMNNRDMSFIKIAQSQIENK
jgi:8-oxo-dGTP diphosphatase